MDAPNQTPSYTKPGATSYVPLPPYDQMLAMDVRVGPVRGPMNHQSTGFHPYLRILPTGRYVNPPNVPAAIAPRQPYRLYDVRRGHHVLTPPPDLTPQFPLLPHPLAVNTSISQHVKLDAKEIQRQRLVRLFLIPEFFKVVREGWGDAMDEERRKNPKTAAASNGTSPATLATTHK
ncbi:hypothetical protein C0991_008725 [Blastosporella zonata]|nr:hypothetical protein C0991_008725 [Blastosporella zonata]